MRRLVGEENGKRRKALRRHYNDTVRELAAFVRKRDKRVLAHQARACCLLALVSDGPAAHQV